MQPGAVRKPEDEVSEPQPQSGPVISASGRSSRTINETGLSQPHHRIASLAAQRIKCGQEYTLLGTGTRSGCDLLVIYGDKDNFPRLRTNLRIVLSEKESKQSQNKFRNFRQPEMVDVPVGTSLEEMARDYPVHVYSQGVRLFIAERQQWTKKGTWEALPAPFRQLISRAATVRSHACLEKLWERQMDEMNEEAGLPTRRTVAECEAVEDLGSEVDGEV